MTKKDIKALADAVVEIKRRTQIDSPVTFSETFDIIEQELIRFCRKQNPRFNAIRFLEACERK